MFASSRTNFGVAALVVSFSLFSCNNDVTLCESSSQSLLGIGFDQVVNGAATDTLLPAVVIFGTGHPDSLYNGLPNSTVALSLDQNRDSSIFYINPDTTGAGDTVLIRYSRKLHLVSPACGFVTFFHIDTIQATNHHIDSVALQTRDINTTHVENVLLFY